MNINSILNEALTKAIELSPATLVYRGTTLTVKKSYTRYESTTMESTYNNQDLDDMFIMARTSEIQDLGIEAYNSAITLDGEQMYVSGVIKKTPVYWKIFLRKKK